MTGARQRPSGFTLTEMLIVIAVILVLAGLLLPALSGGGEKVKLAKAEATIRGLSVALAQYKTHFGFYPASDSANNYELRIRTAAPEGVLTALNRTGGGWDASALADGVLTDPWGRPYVLRYHYDSPDPRTQQGDASSEWNFGSGSTNGPARYVAGGSDSGPAWGGNSNNNWDYWIGENVQYVIYSRGPGDDLKYAVFNVKSNLSEEARKVWRLPKPKQKK